MNTPLNVTLLENVLKNALQSAVLQRYPRYMRPMVVTVDIMDGTAKLLTSLPNGNMTSVVISLRGISEMYKVLDSIPRQVPLFDKYLSGVHTPTETYHADIDWKLNGVMSPT